MIFLEHCLIKVDKEDKKLLKKVKKMKCGDEVRLHGSDVICYDKEFYLIINSDGIFEKHYNEIKDWVIQGGELD